MPFGECHNRYTHEVVLKNSEPTASIEGNDVVEKVESPQQTNSDETFSSSFLLLVASVGPEVLVALHEYINGDTEESVFDNSSGKPC